METAAYLEHRQRWRERAAAAAVALRGGDRALARALVSTWRFEPDLADRLLDRLLATRPRPCPGAWAMTMADAVDVDAPVDAPTALHWRDGAFSQPVGDVGDPLAWGLAELATHSWLVETAERLPWQDRSYRVDPAEDAQVRALWSAWAEGRPWDAREDWETRFLPPALRAFAAVVRGRRLPEDVRKQAIMDAREGFFYALIGDGGTGAGWRELGVRLLEAAGPDPVDALAVAVPVESWERVARCAVTRGHGRSTASLAWGQGVTWQVQARELQLRAQEQPAALGDLLDLHLALRLVECWTQPERTAPSRSMAVVTHNRGRARSRLRAVLREAPADHLLLRIQALPALADRTRAAVARFARDWAWQQVQHGFSFYDARTVDPACILPEGAPPPLSTEGLAALRAWVLLVTLKDRLPHLRQWVHGGAELDKRDTTWGRLLADDCPDLLRSYRGSTRGQGLARLRAELTEHLPALLSQLRPTLARLAAIDLRRGGLKAAFEGAIADAWHPALSLPKVRYRSYIAAAAAACQQLSGEDDA